MLRWNNDEILASNRAKQQTCYIDRLRFREHRVDGIRKALEAIYASYQDIFNTTLLKLS
jgi:hypothetical protein